MTDSERARIIVNRTTEMLVHALLYRNLVKSREDPVFATQLSQGDFASFLEATRHLDGEVVEIRVDSQKFRVVVSEEYG